MIIFAKNSMPPMVSADSISPKIKYAMATVVTVAVIRQLKVFNTVINLLVITCVLQTGQTALPNAILL